MTDTSKDYVLNLCNAAPFADNEAGIPQMVELIKALAAERDELQDKLDVASKAPPAIKEGE